jgi:hypothetical protein
MNLQHQHVSASAGVSGQYHALAQDAQQRLELGAFLWGPLGCRSGGRDGPGCVSRVEGRGGGGALVGVVCGKIRHDFLGVFLVRRKQGR